MTYYNTCPNITDALKDHVELLKFSFEEKYNQSPRFLKLSEDIYYGVYRESVQSGLEWDEEFNRDEMFLGLQLCPTPSLLGLDEIEVF